MKFIRKIRGDKKGYEPLVEVLIRKSNIIHNLRQFQGIKSGVQVAPVLKSNAYGHGLIEVFEECLRDESFPFVVVDSLFEAITLSKAKRNQEILVIGYTRVSDIVRNKRSNIVFTITSLDQLKELASFKKISQRVHLKFDTGMHRQGILIDELSQVFDLLKVNKELLVEGICSHLADADGDQQSFSLNQISVWNQLVIDMKKVFLEMKYWHLSATGGGKFLDRIECNVLRLGIGLYGFNVSGIPGVSLLPALEMRTIVTGIKEIGAGECIGYNGTFVAPRNMKIATIPVGYYEGLDRRLSNVGIVEVGNVPCPIVGRVSMNITVIDVSAVNNIALGDFAEVISSTNSAPNSVTQISLRCQTISYVILVHIQNSLKRRII